MIKKIIFILTAVIKTVYTLSHTGNSFGLFWLFQKLLAFFISGFPEFSDDLRDLSGDLQTSEKGLKKLKKKVERLTKECSMLENVLCRIVNEKEALESELNSDSAARNNVNYYSVGLCAAAVIVGFGLCCFLDGGTSSVVSPLIKTFSKTGD